MTDMTDQDDLTNILTDVSDVLKIVNPESGAADPMGAMKYVIKMLNMDQAIIEKEEEWSTYNILKKSLIQRLAAYQIRDQDLTPLSTFMQFVGLTDKIRGDRNVKWKICKEKYFKGFLDSADTLRLKVLAFEKAKREKQECRILKKENKALRKNLSSTGKAAPITEGVGKKTFDEIAKLVVAIHSKDATIRQLEERIRELETQDKDMDTQLAEAIKRVMRQ